MKVSGLSTGVSTALWPTVALWRVAVGIQYEDLVCVIQMLSHISGLLWLGSLPYLLIRII